MRKEILIIAIIVAIISFATAATAEPTGMDVTIGANDTATVATADPVTAVGGNITKVDVDATLQTANWAGFFGDVTGTLTLSGATDLFYSWGSINTGYVLFSNASTINWASLAIGVGGTAAAEDTELSLTGIDTVAATFTDTVNLSGITLGTTTFGALDTPISVNSSSQGAQDWPTFLLRDAASNGRIYGCAINQTGVDYANNGADYQLLVPSGTSRTYYVFADLQ